MKSLKVILKVNIIPITVIKFNAKQLKLNFTDIELIIFGVVQLIQILIIDLIIHLCFKRMQRTK